jgi:Fe-S-cluster containining protein
MDQQPPAPQNLVEVKFSLSLAGGQLSATVQVPAGASNLVQILPLLQGLDDAFIDDAASELAAAGQPISCKQGCNHCCYHAVPISLVEAEALAEWIRTLPADQQQELARRFRETILKLSAAGFMESLAQDDWLSPTEDAARRALDYLYQRIPCPFLEDGSCSIYPIRPFGCREYLVVSAPEHCFDPVTRQIKGVQLPRKFFPMLGQICAETDEKARGWIPLVFLFEWMEAGSHFNQIGPATGPEVLYDFLQRMSTPKPPAPSNA